MILGLLKYHTLVLLREPMNLFFGLGFPFLNLFLFSGGMEEGDNIITVLPVLLIVASIVLCFTDAATSHAYARQIKFLRRLRMTPAKSVHYILTGILTRIAALGVLAAGLVGVMVVVFDGDVSEWNWGMFVPMVLISFIMMYLIGMFIANALKGAKNSGNLVYVVFFFLLIAGGFMFPLSAMPDALQTVARNLPPMHAVAIMESAFTGTDLFYGHSFIAVVGFTTVFALLSVKFFKYE